MGGRSAVYVTLAAWIGLGLGVAAPSGAIAGLALVFIFFPLALGQWNRLGTLALLGVALGAGLARGAAAEWRLTLAMRAETAAPASVVVWLRTRVVTHPAREG